MSDLTHDIRLKLRDLGWMSTEPIPESDALTVCQFVVVGLSLLSVIFLLAPLFYVQHVWFMVIFFSFSLGSLFGGIWFWVKQGEICEHPEVYSE